MILLGRDLSPFVRRSATVLNLLGVEYQRRIVSTADDADEIRQHNPLGRVPALILENEALVDSAAIIDYVLEIADPEHKLLAASGEARRQTLQLSALATGTMEKGVASAYEASQRPPELVYQPYREKLQQQALAGLVTLDQVAPATGWFGGSEPNLADVNAVVAFDFLNLVAADAAKAVATGPLAQLAARANEQAAFASTRWNGGNPFG